MQKRERQLLNLSKCKERDNVAGAQFVGGPGAVEMLFAGTSVGTIAKLQREEKNGTR
jgi:hypothetical protein